MDKFNEFYMLQNQAKKFEQGGMDDKALELYLKIIGEYLPNNDFSYDRASTLLEKKNRYAEALSVCEKALTLIKAADIQGDAAKFTKKMERIRSKSTADASVHTIVSKKAPEEFHFGLPGFRSHQKLMMVLGALYYALAALAAYPDQPYAFLFLFMLAFFGSYGLETLMKLANGKACTKAAALTLVALAAAGFSASQMPQVQAYWNVDGTQQSEEAGERSEKDGSGPEGGSTADPDADTDREAPEIPTKYLIAAAKAAEKNPASEYADLTVDGTHITMSLIVKPGTSQGEIEAMAAEMTRTLGGLMTSENLKGPDDSSFGELYTFYAATVLVTDTLDQELGSGELMKNEPRFEWEK